MLFPSSGRVCFENFGGCTKSNVPSSSLLCSMLKRENELRLCDESQRWLETHEDSSAEDFYLGLQKRVAFEFGFETEEQQTEGALLMRSALSFYPGDENIKNAVLYLKYNRSEQGKLSVGDVCPDVEMRSCAGEVVRLSSFASELPLVLVAGSGT